MRTIEELKAIVFRGGIIDFTEDEWTLWAKENPIRPSTPPLPEQCSNCRFYKQYNDILGTCRRYPPVFRRYDEVDEPVCRQVSADPDDWCGEFKPKESA